jgi:hypothetical protein
MKNKIIKTKEKILNLKIKVHESKFDSNGKLIFEEIIDSPSFNIDGVFNSYLLSEDYMNKQKYTGYISPSESANIKNKNYVKNNEYSVSVSIQEHNEDA